MAKKLFHHGDVFAVPLPDGQFLFGRVMLDIYATTERQLFPADSSLPGLGKALLIEMYQQVSPSPNYEPSNILVPGAFIEADDMGTRWPIVSHVAIDVQEVQFPESMVGYMHDEGEVAFQCGEISLPLPHYPARIELNESVANEALRISLALPMPSRTKQVKRNSRRISSNLPSSGQ